MNLEQEPSREVRRVINAIHDLSELESQIPLCKTIDEVEEIRLRCQAIQYPAHEHKWDVGAQIVQWAKRCAVLCELRITELQDIARRKRNGEQITATGDLPPLSRSEQNRRSEHRAILSLPKEELEKHLDAGTTDTRKLAGIARKSRKKAAPKSTPEKRAKELARYYRKKAEKQASCPPLQAKRSPAQKFERYWPQEEKLLQQFFTNTDLSAIEGYWIRAFQSYRKDVEDGKRERQEALAKLKTTTAPGTDAVAGEGK